MRNHGVGNRHRSAHAAAVNAGRDHHIEPAEDIRVVLGIARVSDIVAPTPSGFELIDVMRDEGGGELLVKLFILLVAIGF